MQLFYNTDFHDNIFLDKNESKHLIKVLRKKNNDIINITDGIGNLYIAEIINDNPKACQLRLVEKKKKKKHKYNLHIAIAPTKNIERFEWFLEKATEIGIDEITPLICEKSERRKIKIERCEKIIISALKQSLKFHKPKLNPPTLFNDFVKKENHDKKYIASCNDLDNLELKNEDAHKSCTILIGPEGDFSIDEVSKSIKNNFAHIILGKSRLRTETAGIVAVSCINMKF